MSFPPAIAVRRENRPSSFNRTHAGRNSMTFRIVLLLLADTAVKVAPAPRGSQLLLVQRDFLYSCAAHPYTVFFRQPAPSVELLSKSIWRCLCKAFGLSPRRRRESSS